MRKTPHRIVLGSWSVTVTGQRLALPVALEMGVSFELDQSIGQGFMCELSPLADFLGSCYRTSLVRRRISIDTWGWRRIQTNRQRNDRKCANNAEYPNVMYLAPLFTFEPNVLFELGVRLFIDTNRYDELNGVPCAQSSQVVFREHMEGAESTSFCM